MLNAIKRFIKSLRCEHNWVHVRRIREQNLRSGFAHYSDVYHCTHCRKAKTIELDP